MWICTCKSVWNNSLCLYNTFCFDFYKDTLMLPLWLFFYLCLPKFSFNFNLCSEMFKMRVLKHRIAFLQHRKQQRIGFCFVLFCFVLLFEKPTGLTFPEKKIEWSHCYCEKKSVLILCALCFTLLFRKHFPLCLCLISRVLWEVRRLASPWGRQARAELG